MKNIWKGLVLGALTGAAAGAGLDRRAAKAGGSQGLSAVAGGVPSGPRLHQGIADAAGRVRDADVHAALSDAIGSVRQTFEEVADGSVADAVRQGVTKAAAASGSLSDTAHDVAAKAAAGGKEAAATARSGLTGS